MRAIALSALLLCAPALGECWIEPTNSPAFIYSWDFYALDLWTGYPYLAYIIPGGIELGVMSPAPNCPQLMFVYGTTPPLDLAYLSTVNPFFFNFVFADNWGYVPYYPWSMEPT